MGWVGVGAFVVAVAYLLYKCPPSSRSNPTPSPPDSNPDTFAPANTDSTRDKSPTTPPPGERQNKSPQLTPKASTSAPAPPPVIAVPTLNLDESHTTRVAERPAQQSMNGSAQQVATGRDGSTASSQPSSLAPSSQPTPTAKPTSLMPPPPPPVSRLQAPAQPNRPSGGLAPPRVSGSPRTPLSAAASARLSPNGGTGLSTSTLAPTLPSLKKSNASKRVILEPGYSPLDWAALAADPKSQLRGVGLPPGLLRVTPSMLKMQNGRKGRDAWTSYQGKVYNISPYLPYHPGGKGELLRGAGKDSGKLFQEIHPWVNWDGMLGECMVGILVSENDVQAENALDAMD